MPYRHLRTASFIAVSLLGLAGPAPLQADQPQFSREDIFTPEPTKHNHSSCIVELENGDLLVSWYRGTGERKADDVQIVGSRLKKGSPLWEPRFLIADTPGYPDCNPALFVAPDHSVWVFWPTILDHHWESALLKYRRAEMGGESGSPAWVGPPGVIHVSPTGFGKAIKDAIANLNGEKLAIDETEFNQIRDLADNELYQRLGWMPRVHPLVLPSGRWLLPLYTDTFSCSLIAISDDQGTTWSFSEPIIGFGNIQPSLVRKNDGTIVAYMRENGGRRKIRVSSSKDDGKTWSPVASSDLPNPGAGIEAIRLANGHWAMIYNDLTDSRHSLAIAISEDEGATWPIARHVERTKPGDSFHYPSIIQTHDGMIHLSYTRRTSEGSTIEHARFNEEWVRQPAP